MDDLMLELQAGQGDGPTDRSRRRRLAATAAICGMAFIGLGQLTTGAFFADSTTSNFTYTSGDVVITAGTVQSFDTAALGNMAPGDTRFSAVDVTNGGKLDLRYAITGKSLDVGTGSLSSVMEYSVYAVNASTCAAADAKGSMASASPLNSTPVTLGSADTPLVGSNAQGIQSGDRSLLTGSASTATDSLCIAATLPITATNTVADSTVKVTLTFWAEQTVNNGGN